MPSRGRADLYLLTEPSQGAMFDLRLLSAALAWNRPSLTRLRLVSSRGEDYRERIVIGDLGGVVAVRREYWRELTGSHRVLLTASASIARRWSEGRDRRGVWIQLRQSGNWARSDHHRVAGECFQIGDASQEGLLLTEIIGRWNDPDRAIDGIESVTPGVWTPKGQREMSGDIMVAPVWVGLRGDGHAPIRVVGPAWSSDCSGHVASPARVLEIDEVREPSHSGDRRSMGEADQGYDSVKRAIDIIASGCGLVVLSPLLMLVAIAVLLDDGWPIVFGHERQTRGGRNFSCLKFRTMRRDAEALAKSFQDQNVCDGPQVYIENDPRVTRVGRVLRKYHLDELLQLFNVLSGDMSLVGPRPSPERENRLCPAWRDARLSVRPGITGLWQVCRTRSPGLDFQEWIRFDMRYVQSRSLRLDAWIIYQTLRGIIKKGSSHGVVEANAT
jgi:lipopolysaccharide/colanic/teichoic acid biosynthesis glycosyltransferase